MGICVTKRERESIGLLASSLLANPPSTPECIHQLIDLQKDETLPVVSLATSSLFLSSAEMHKALDSTCEEVSLSKTKETCS